MAQAKAPCLVPGPHYSSQPKRFGSRDPSENAKGLGKRRTGTTMDRDWTLQGLILVPRARRFLVTWS